MTYTWNAQLETEFLAAERTVESGGNYTANNPGGASGAYQFEQSTWDYWVTKAGFPQWAGKRPSSAPPGVQDAAAGAMATSYYSRSGSLLTTAESWYYPAVAGTPAAATTVPPGNRDTVLQYGQDVLAHLAASQANDAGTSTAQLTGWSPAQLLPIITGGVAGDIPGGGLPNPAGAITAPIVGWLDNWAVRAALFVLGAVALLVGLIHLTRPGGGNPDPLGRLDPFPAEPETPARPPESPSSRSGRTNTAPEAAAAAE